MSVNRKVNEIMKGESAPEMAMFMKQIEYAHPRPNVPNYDQLETGVNPYFYSVLDGTMSVGQGLSKAADFVRSSIIPALSE
jgi:maltose-binding protein MalE